MIRVAIFLGSVGVLASAIYASWRNESGGVALPNGGLFLLLAGVVLLNALSLRQLNTWYQSSLLGQPAKAVAIILVVVLMALPFMLAPDYLEPARDIESRTAPNGAPATSIQWQEKDGRYYETINGTYRTELSRSEYQQIMRLHQLLFLHVAVFFAHVGVIGTLAGLLLPYIRNSRRGS